jgi:hypothetical protein
MKDLAMSPTKEKHEITPWMMVKLHASGTQGEAVKRASLLKGELSG